MYFRKMTGEKCYLSPIDVDDAGKYTEWLNDYETTRYLTLATMNITVQSEKDVLNRLAREHNYAIVDLNTDTLIGNCGLLDVDHINRTAEVGIFIGDKEYLGKGYGREALSLLIDYAFSVLNLRNIMLRVYSFNERAVNSYKAIGFRLMGKRRKALIRDGKEHDILFFDLLEPDFRKMQEGSS